MAEIRVEPKRRSLAWLWAVLALVVIGLVVWYLNNDGVNQVDVAPTSGLAPATPALVAARAAPAMPSTLVV